MGGIYVAKLDPGPLRRHAQRMTDQAPALPQTAAGEALTFEQALRGLEEIVKRLESGDVPLDDSISLYEEGERLRKLCQARLDAAQARIERIVATPEGATTKPFDGAEG